MAKGLAVLDAGSKAYDSVGPLLLVGPPLPGPYYRGGDIVKMHLAAAMVLGFCPIRVHAQTGGTVIGELMRQSGVEALPEVIAIPTAPASSAYKYNVKTGQCLDKNGNRGLNPIVKQDLFHLSAQPIAGPNSFLPVNAECVDFSGINMIMTAGVEDYVDLINWNLRGAKFKKTDLNLVRMYGDLSGADLSEAIFAYSQVMVITNKYTKLHSFCLSERGTLTWNSGYVSKYDTVCLH